MRDREKERDIQTDRGIGRKTDKHIEKRENFCGRERESERKRENIYGREKENICGRERESARNRENL